MHPNERSKARAARNEVLVTLQKAWRTGGLREAQNVLCRFKRRRPTLAAEAEMAFHDAARSV